MRIASVGRAFPGHYYDAEQTIAGLRGIWRRRPRALTRIESIHRNARVGGRHLLMPIERTLEPRGPGAANDLWIEGALDLGERAIRDALERAGLEARDVDAIFAVSITGIANPSIEARLMNRIDFRSDVARVPIFGLGCVGGAAGVARAADYVKAWPDRIALLLTVEICSLTFQEDDVSVANIIATGLFGDGAACAVLAGADRPPTRSDHPRPHILATRSSFYRDTEGVMGWDITDAGFRIVLTPRVAEMVRLHLRADVDALLADHGLTRKDVHFWICHPGGPRVLEALEDALEVPREALARSWATLEMVGNLSSASVLLVLGDTMDEASPRAGDLGLMIAMGPGFCSEAVLLRWDVRG